MTQFDDCRCGWGRAAWEQGHQIDQNVKRVLPADYGPFEDGEELHSLLMSLDSGVEPYGAIAEMIRTMLDDDIMPRRHGPDFGTLFAQHNWRDPVGMTALAVVLDNVAGMQDRLHWLDKVATGEIKPDIDRHSPANDWNSNFRLLRGLRDHLTEVPA